MKALRAVIKDRSDSYFISFKYLNEGAGETADVSWRLFKAHLTKVSGCE